MQREPFSFQAIGEGLLKRKSTPFWLPGISIFYGDLLAGEIRLERGGILRWSGEGEKRGSENHAEWRETKHEQSPGPGALRGKWVTAVPRKMRNGK